MPSDVSYIPANIALKDLNCFLMLMQGSHVKNTVSPVPSAAHVRIMQKGSADHLALNIDSEADRLINSEETDEDKGLHSRILSRKVTSDRNKFWNS